MREQITRALTGSPESPSLLFRRTYGTTAADVWEALTDPVRASRWLGRVEGAPRGVGDAFLLRFADAPEQPAE